MIFGGILSLPFLSGTIVFIAVLVVFTVFEGLLHILEVECSKHGLKGLVKKMYREFMILGFISFAILLATELSEFKTNIWYDAFHFAHIVILFVGFVFLVQSGLLSALVRYRNRALLAHDNSSSEELIIEYVNLHNKGGFMKFLYDFGPISIPWPALREKIEYKIIQEFFIRNYNLPPEFKFANYMCGVLRHYVISLVEVRPISWVILAGFVSLNLFRVEVIDPIYSKSVCHQYPAKNLHLSSHRMLMDVFAGGGGGNGTDDHAYEIAYGQHVCQEYLLRYVFVLLFFLVFYVVGVLVASEIYIQRLIGKVLDQEETIEWLEDEEHRNQMMMMSPDMNPKNKNNQFVDISQLPDDTLANQDVAKCEGSGDVEMGHVRTAGLPPRGSKDSTDLSAAFSLALPAIILAESQSQSQSQGQNRVPGTPGSATAPKGAAAHVGPRRMTAAYRQSSLRVRSGSAADIPEELVDQVPPVPVYGAANVRRLSMIHRRNSLKDAELAAVIAAGIAGEYGSDRRASPATEMLTSPLATQAQAQARRLSNNHKAHSYVEVPKSPLGLDVPSAAPPVRPRLERENSAPIEGDASAQGPMRRRLASHHRMGSLRSEISQIEAENQAAANRRLQPQHRQPSIRSEYSEKNSSKNADSTNGKGMKLVSAHNRRFLYLRCLERIMHVEFDFHANEAKRLGQQEGVGMSSKSTSAVDSSAAGTGTETSPNPRVPASGVDPLSPARRARGNTAIYNHQGSMRDLLHSPTADQRRERGNTIRRPGSPYDNFADAGAGAGAGAGTSIPGGDLDLLHTDMRSNFRLMKDLRKEMLEEEKQQALLNSPAPNTAAFNLANMKLFKGGPHGFSMRNLNASSHGQGGGGGGGGVNAALSTHGVSARPQHALVPQADPMPSPLVTPVPVAPTGSKLPVVRCLSMDIELGGPAPHEIREFELAHDFDNDEIDVKEGETASGRPKHPRTRTFSLDYVSGTAQSNKTITERRYEYMSHFDKFLFNTRVSCVNLYHSMVNALMGHHIGHEEEVLDADIADLQEDFTHIFLFRSAEFYYFSVEFCLLVQCVYLALWATNFIFIALDSYHPVLWNIALLVPVPVNFLITKQIIFTSVMVKSIVTLDKYVADKICEDAADERNVKQRVRKVIRTALRTLEIPRENWEQFTMEQFERYIPDNDVGLKQQHLKLFLHSLQIFLTDATVHHIFTSLDFDKDEKLVWDEIRPIVFPELVRKQVKLKRKKSARRATMSFDYHFEGELVTAEAKKDEQKRHRKERRASLMAEDTAARAEKEKRKKSKKERRNAVVDPNDTKHDGSEESTPEVTSNHDRKAAAARRQTRGTAGSVSDSSANRLGSDDSDHGDSSSDSSINSHSLGSMSSSSGYEEDGEDFAAPSGSAAKVIKQIASSTDMDDALSYSVSSRASPAGGSNLGSQYDTLSHRSVAVQQLRGQDAGEEEGEGEQKSVRFSKMFDV